jgi:hypothetical protein
MKDLLLTLLHLAVTTAKLCGPGGVRAVIAENLLLKQQLIVLRRPRQRAPNLTVRDRLLCGFGCLRHLLLIRPRFVDRAGTGTSAAQLCQSL